MSPEIRIVVLDTTGPTERLGMEPCSWARALAFHGLAFHGLPQTQKPRRVAATGSQTARKSKSVSQG
jgi:hypothetical protein